MPTGSAAACSAGSFAEGSSVAEPVSRIAEARFVPFSLSQLLVPGTAAYRPLAVAFGVVAAELLAALAVTNHYRKRLPHRLWRRLHMLNFAVWGLALVHGLTAGTDARTTWALVLYAGSAWLVLALLVHRVSLHWAPVKSTERSTQWQ